MFAIAPDSLCIILYTCMYMCIVYTYMYMCIVYIHVHVYRYAVHCVRTGAGSTLHADTSETRRMLSRESQSTYQLHCLNSELYYSYYYFMPHFANEVYTIVSWSL